MNQYQMIFGIVFVVMFFSFFKTWAKHRYARPEKGEMDATIREQLELIKQLEQRVQVLEKIVTDGNYDLRRKFEDLETGT